MGDSSSIEIPVKLPTADLVKVDDHISLLPPLSRRGHGPGLILILPQDTPSYAEGGVVCENGIPPPLLKWAEEGFAVVEIREGAFTTTAAVQEVFAEATAALESCEPCSDEDGIGLIGKFKLFACSREGPRSSSLRMYSLRLVTMAEIYSRHHFRLEDQSGRHLRRHNRQTARRSIHTVPLPSRRSDRREQCPEKHRCCQNIFLSDREVIKIRPTEPTRL